jgi:hypothetical protein
MTYSRTVRVFILEHYLSSKYFAAVREAFSNVYHGKEVSKENSIQTNKISGHKK